MTTEKMKTRHFLGDGLGMVTLNTISGFVGILTYFYTDKIGLAAGAVGTIILIAKILDAFTDLIMGHIVDHTKSKYGKAKPWLLWMVIPTFVTIVALFLIPAHMSMPLKLTYALISNILVTAVVYTAIAIPYGSLISLSTADVMERSKMGIVRSAFGFLIGMIIAIALIPITNLLGGDQKAWIIIAVIFAVISSVSLFVAFLSTKERNHIIIPKDKSAGSEEHLPFGTAMYYLFKNHYWVLMLFANLFINVSYSLSGATGIYYTKYILKNENLVAIMGAVGLLPVFIGFGIVGPCIKKFGLASTARYGMILSIVGTAIRLFAPSSFILALIGGSLATLGTIPMMAVGGVLVNNTIEYGEWKFGHRIVGMTNSASGFGAKIGSGLGAAMIGWMLAFGCYDGTLAVQSSSATQMILMLCIHIPLVLYILILIFLYRYDLDKRYGEICDTLKQRRNAQ